MSQDAAPRLPDPDAFALRGYVEHQIDTLLDDYATAYGGPALQDRLASVGKRHSLTVSPAPRRPCGGRVDSRDLHGAVLRLDAMHTEVSGLHALLSSDVGDDDVDANAVADARDHLGGAVDALAAAWGALGRALGDLEPDATDTSEHAIGVFEALGRR